MLRGGAVGRTPAESHLREPIVIIVPMDRGKRLSQSNIIGGQGEAAFEVWAYDHFLSPNKAPTDVGIDYFCQVMKAIPNSTSMEGTGELLCAQVKTVADAHKPRLTLSRIDATDLLRQTQATCLFGVRLSDKRICFQFVTKDFIDRLSDFLLTSNDKFTVSHESMSGDGALFLRLLRKYANPFEQVKLRSHLARRRVTTAISGAELAIHSSEENTACQVYVPWASSAYEVEPSARENIRLKVLRGGEISPDEPGAQLHPAITDLARETSSSLLQVTGVVGHSADVMVQHQGRSATERFVRHSYETEIAYVHRAGLRLSYDAKPRSVGVELGHKLESEIFEPPKRVPLTGNVLVFFRLFKPGAVLSLRSDWDISLSSFGDSLEHVGEAIDSIPDLCKSLGLDLSHIALPDLNDEEFVRTTWFLEALLLRGVSLTKMMRGFIVGPAADLPLEQVPTSPLSISLPVAVNWKDKGILVWVECDGEAFLNDGLICGMRLTQQKSWRIEKRGRFQKSIWPEVWVAKIWPAIRIGGEPSEVQQWTFDLNDLRPLEAILGVTP